MDKHIRCSWFIFRTFSGPLDSILAQDPETKPKIWQDLLFAPTRSGRHQISGPWTGVFLQSLTLLFFWSTRQHKVWSIRQHKEVIGNQIQQNQLFPHWAFVFIKQNQQCAPHPHPWNLSKICFWPTDFLHADSLQKKNPKKHVRSNPVGGPFGASPRQKSMLLLQKPI